MERDDAVRKLKQLIGQDLLPLAAKYGITVWKGRNLNKGWAGHVYERYLGLPLNSSQAPNFGSWEMKNVPLKRLQNGKIVPKETMAITMIDPVHVLQTSFEESHLLAKLRKGVVCARLVEKKPNQSCRLISVSTFDIEDAEIYKTVKADYDLVRSTIKRDGFGALTGRMGVFVQPRTKGPGHGSTSRAFYARTGFVSIILGL